MLRSPSKINLTLDILGKDPSGYHEIQSVLCELPTPTDEIKIETNETGAIKITCTDPYVPLDEGNTVFKAVRLLQEKTGISQGVDISIDKKIPVAAGLGGGSSNAVSVLKALGKQWGVGEDILKKIGDEIGMDCAFFFHGGVALGEHFGEKITPLPQLPASLHIAIIPTGVAVSSRWAYENIDLVYCGADRGKTRRLLEALTRKNAEEIIANAHNDFEALIFKTHPELPRIKKEIEAKKGGRVLLCGSGGALYHLTQNAVAP